MTVRRRPVGRAAGNGRVAVKSEVAGETKKRKAGRPAETGSSEGKGQALGGGEAKRKKTVRAARTSAARGIEDWWRVRLILGRTGGGIDGFVDRTGLSRSTVSRILGGGTVSPAARNSICTSFGYDKSIWDPIPGGIQRGLRELEREFYAWLDAGSALRTHNDRLIKELDFLVGPHPTLVGRGGEIARLDAHLARHDQAIVEICGGSGAGKTELVRGWWIATGRQRINGHVLAFSCRRLGGTDALFDRFRSLTARHGEGEYDLPGLLVRALRSPPGRSTLIVLDDIDFLMHDRRLSADGPPRRQELLFDRAGLQELIGRLVVELKPVVFLVTSSSELQHLFGGYPGYLSIDLRRRGLAPEDGAELILDVLDDGGRARATDISREALVLASRKLRGLPQSLVHLAYLIREAPEARRHAVLELLTGWVAGTAATEATPTAIQLVEQLTRASLNFVRIVSGFERGLESKMLELLIEDQLASRLEDRIFALDVDPDSFLIDKTVDRTLGLVSRVPIAGAGDVWGYDMHLTARDAVLRHWRTTEGRSFVRYSNWLARHHWNLVYSRTDAPYSPQLLPEEPNARRDKLIALLEAAYHLARGAAVEALPSMGDRDSEPTVQQYIDPRGSLVRDKKLTPNDIDFVMSERSPPGVRVQFAFRRIVGQRVDRGERGKFWRKNRFGLTRRFGRHEAKIRFLALLAPRLFYGHADGLEPIDLLDPVEQGEVLVDAGYNALQLGWLYTAGQAFIDARRRLGNVGRNMDASRASALESLALMWGGLLQAASIALDRADQALVDGRNGGARVDQQVEAMERRIKSFRARVMLLEGNVEDARRLQSEIHTAIRDSNGTDVQFLGAIKNRVERGDLSPVVAGETRSLPEIALLGERGRLHIETELVHARGGVGDILGYWWSCYQMAAEDGVEVEHTHLHILEAAIHRLRNDRDEALRALGDADRIGEEYNVHFPIRLEWRLEHARVALWFGRDEELSAERSRLETVLELARSYGFKLLECDAWIIRGWLDRLQQRPLQEMREALRNAERLINTTNYQLRKSDLEHVRAGGGPTMVPLI